GAGANSQGLTVSGVDLCRNGKGIALETSNDGATIVGSNVYGNNVHGMDVAAAGVTIVGNNVYANGQDGVAANGAHITIRDNSVHDNADRGIGLVFGIHGLISGNDVYRNRNKGGQSAALFAHAWDVNAAGDDRLVVSGNKVHDNGGDGISTYGGAGGEIRV